MAPVPDPGGSSAVSFRNTLASARTHDARSLLDLSERGPLLLVFLRHFG
jgi:hypothetical protein